MCYPHTLIVELNSHVEKLEHLAQSSTLYIDARDFDVAVSLSSILRVISDEEMLIELFAHSDYGVMLTAIFSRAYVVLEFMYLPDSKLSIESEAYAEIAVKHIWRVLKAYAWQFK